MLDPDVRRVLDGTSIAHLATVLPDGSPHTTPVYIGAHGDRIVFFTGPGMRKARNLRREWRCRSRPLTTRSSPLSSVGGSSSGSTAPRRGRSSTGWPRSTPVRPTPRGHERVVAVIEPEQQTVGVG
jgi:Pyridoxamine 5'-phosphate oxidase